MDIDALAEATAGYSGAELAAVCREAGLQAIGRGLTKGLAPHQVVVCRQDVNRALTALKSKRLHREANSEDEKNPEKHAVFSGVC
jgi:SpoVK/Ycf46/Vps4 family AAA+-type ATPase